MPDLKKHERVNFSSNKAKVPALYEEIALGQMLFKSLSISKSNSTDQS